MLFIKMASALRCFWGLSLTLSLSLHLIHSKSTSHVYVVYLGHVHHTDPLLTYEHHLHHLANVHHSKEEAKQAMVHSYKHSFSGFAATLNASQAAILRNTSGVISVFKSRTLKLHTTRSWDFMGLTLDYNGGSIPLQLTHGEDVIVGVFDSGVWPESPSFHEEAGMGPVPKQWRGGCDNGEEFEAKKHCNKKLIGARYIKAGFEKRYGKINKTDYISARDILGHGTHTASTAVGTRLNNASLFGLAGGVARGGAPRARLAVYKVCWSYGGVGKCTDADTLAAFDQALHDGVHVISASIGRPPPLSTFVNSGTGIGSFHAMQMGVSVVLPAGNSGPDLSTVENVYPWSISVAASSVDRTFPTTILVHDGTATSSFVGEGLITKPISGALARTRDYFRNGICDVDNRNVTGKSASGLILVCFSNDGSEELSMNAEYAAREINASALIFVQPITRPIAALSIIPLVRLDILQGTKLGLLNYGTMLHILPTETALKRSSAPVVATFSSRGPSSISPDFLKPDISAPGVNILAAWSPKAPPTEFSYDHRSFEWNFDSGTSMSCPHVSGVVALVKSAYPHWSPAAIRSAIMTTAYNTDIFGDGIQIEASQKSGDPLDIGSGHINPKKALDPGLIYDTTTQEYVNLLCNMGYSEAQIQSMVVCPPSQTSGCSRCHEKPQPNGNINYPSISVPDLRCATTVKRTVRNVGPFETAVYYVSVVKPHGVDVEVWPRVLVFSVFKEEITYKVTMSPVKISSGRYDFGSITWSDGFHHVRTPLVVQVNTVTTPPLATVAVALSIH